MSRICIVTLMIGPLPYKENAKKNHEKYCKKHGYTYKCIEKAEKNCHPAWMKPVVMERILNSNEYDYVMWNDADSFFVNMDIRIEDLIWDPEADMIITGDANDVCNNGHIIMKNTEWSKQFLTKWKLFQILLPENVLSNFKKITTHFCNQQMIGDQTAINIMFAGGDENNPNTWFDAFNRINLYKGNPFRVHKDPSYAPICRENLQKARLLICEKYRSHIQLIEQPLLNSYPSNIKPKDFVLHFVGHKHIINAWVACPRKLHQFLRES